MVCPSTYFPSLNREKVNNFDSLEVKVGQEENIVEVPFDLKEHVEFVGVKAVSEDG